MRLLCQRVVWQLAGEPALTFRPFNDGTLSDAQDNDGNPERGRAGARGTQRTVSAQQLQEWLRPFQGLRSDRPSSINSTARCTRCRRR